jgi:hypothetical protein
MIERMGVFPGRYTVVAIETGWEFGMGETQGSAEVLAGWRERTNRPWRQSASQSEGEIKLIYLGDI